MGHTEDQASRHSPRRHGLPAQPHRLQSCPYPETRATLMAPATGHIHKASKRTTRSSARRRPNHDPTASCERVIADSEVFQRTVKARFGSLGTRFVNAAAPEGSH